MNSLIVSNRILKTEHNPDVELYSWTPERPSAENYQNVVLDLYFGEHGPGGYVTLKGTDQAFYGIGTEIAKSLKAGGVVIATLGPLAINQRKLNANDHETATISLRQRFAAYAEKYRGENETSYDWLDQGFLEVTEIDALHRRRSSNVHVAAHWKEAQEYFRNVKHFWISPSGLKPSGTPAQATLSHPIVECYRWGTAESHCESEAWILAFSEHTREPIATVLHYLRNPGLLVLVPPFDMEWFGTSRHLDRSHEIERILVDFADSVREHVPHFDPLGAPHWAAKHRSQKGAHISEQIKELGVSLDSLTGELAEYDEMLSLLYAKGDLLSRQVQRLFADPSGDITMERTPPGHSLDLFIKDNSGRSLAVEVTGTRGKLTKDDHHWADFLHYLPEHNEKNQSGRVERIVLIVNTQAELPLEDRTREDDITRPVLEIAHDNHICIMRSCDLYRLWVLSQDGSMPLQQIFDILFEHEGLCDSSGL